MFTVKSSPNPLAPTSEEDALSRMSAGRAALTEANRHTDILHISLVGMTAIIFVLLFAVALPVFNREPVRQMWAFVVMVATSLTGIGYLYYINYRVHLLLGNQARLTEVLVNSLGQGFLSFNAEGICGRVYSQACLDLLETVPAQKNIIEVLKIPEDQRSDFKDWLEVLFMPNHALGFDDVVKFLPQTFPHRKDRKISLMYRPIRDKNDYLTHVVAIATDRTEEFEAQKNSQRQQNFADMICHIFKERNQFLATVNQIRKFIAMQGAEIAQTQSSQSLRALHTLKAAVKHFHLEGMSETVCRLETDLRSYQIKTPEDFTRVLQEGQNELAAKLQEVMEFVQGIVGQDYEGRGNLHEVEEATLYNFATTMKTQHADKELIRDYLADIVAVPITECFKSFEREVTDLAQIMGKQLRPIRYTGSNPRVLVRTMQDFLLSLSHIARNIIDHGIEPSVTRLARGKDPQGQVSIHADLALDGNNQEQTLHIIISDDGAGIDPTAVRAKLATTDPQGDWRTEDDQTVIQRIFSWGFSLRDNITDLSGRGVGMEAVEREIRLMGGTIKVYSELYHSTKFDIKIPYHLDFEGLDLDAVG